MPEPPIPTPTRDRPVSRNLFVEADPDLDALAQSRADEPARSAGAASTRSRPRRSRRAVPIAPQRASARCRALHPSERQRRELAGRSVPRHPAGRRGRRTAAARTWQPGPTAHWSRSSRSRCFCSPSAGWCSTSATYPRRGERPTGGWLATPSRSDTSRRGSGLSPPSSARSRRPRASRRRARHPQGRWISVPGRRRPTRRRPAATTVIADRHVATARATAITRGDARPRGRGDRSPPRGKHPRQLHQPTCRCASCCLTCWNWPGYPTTMGGRSVRSAGDPYPPDRTLAELGVGDGALLALRELAGRGSADRDSATTQRMIPSARGTDEQPGGRPLSDRTARLLPSGSRFRPAA